MSDTNGRLAPSANGTAKARLTANPTRRYTPSTTGTWWGYGSGVIDGKPFFTWMDVPRMIRDPNVRFAERMWRAPFHRVKWAVKAESPKVAQFVGTSLRRIWRRSLPKLLSRYFRYGYAPGGAEFVERKGLIRADRVRAVEPLDARPRVWTCGPNAGQAAGFTLGHGNAITPALSGESWVGPEHAVWFSGMQEFGPFYDMPPMSGMFEPWLEKNTRGGAIQARQVHARKCAGVGGMLRHPDGEVNMGTAESPRRMDGQDVARQMLDYMESWAHLTLTNEAHPGIPGKFAWEYTPPQVMPDAPHLREYVQQLDKEMLRGIGIPPEVLEASEVGSGWSGRMIPLTSFLAGVDELAGLLIECLDSPLRYAVQANFGAGTWYEVEPQSLAEEAQKQGKGDGKSGEGDNPIPGLLGLAGRDKSRDPTTKPTGGALEMSDDRSPIAADIAAKAQQLGHRRKRDLIQIVVLAMLKAQEQAARRGKPESAGAYLDQLSQLAQDPDRLAEITGTKSMSWTPYNGARGGHGWKNTETGRIVYSDTKPGERREKAQASGQKAREILTKVTRQQATPDDLVELADHLPALPVARLRTARLLLGASWGGSKLRREGMVSALLEHVRGRIEHERTHGPAKDTRPEREHLPANWKDAEKPKKKPLARRYRDLKKKHDELAAKAASAKQPHEAVADEAVEKLGVPREQLIAAATALAEKDGKQSPDYSHVAEAAQVYARLVKTGRKPTEEYTPGSPAVERAEAAMAKFAAPATPVASFAAQLNARHRGTKSSEVNSLMRAAAALTPEQAAAVVKSLGYEPDKDPRRQLVAGIAERQGTKLRSGLVHRPDHPQSVEIAALGDEPLLTPDEVLKSNG